LAYLQHRAKKQQIYQTAKTALFDSIRGLRIELNEVPRFLSRLVDLGTSFGPGLRVVSRLGDGLSILDLIGSFPPLRPRLNASARYAPDSNQAPENLSQNL
jgi:hypothetical protein